MDPAPLSGEARAASWRVFALVLWSSAYFFQSSGHNEAARFDQLRSLAEHGELWIDRFSSNTADTVLVDGRTYPNKAPGTTWLGLFPWKVARALLSVLPLDPDQQLILVTYLLTVLMSALPTALVSLLILRFLARSGFSFNIATLLGAGYGVGSIAFPWATTFFGHQLAACFAFGGFYIVWNARHREGDAANTRLFAAGGLLGFLPVIEYPAAIASVLIVLYAVFALGVRRSSFLAAGALIGALPLPLYNAAAFGDPLALSYRFHQEGSLFPAHQQGFAGVSWPRLDILHEITFKPARGLFPANPWLVFALVAPIFWRRLAGLRPEFLMSAAIFASALAFNSGFGDSIVYWGGAFSFGPRHILFALPFAALLVAAPMTSRILRPLIALTLVLTAILMIPVAAVDPRVPYEPASPLVDFHLPLYARGLHSAYPHSTFGEGIVFDSSGAFNLGRAIGLPRDLEILPLAFVWAIAAFGLVKATTRIAPLAARTLAAALVIAMGLWPALPRFSPRHVREPGLCQAVSRNHLWPYFSDYALQGEPSPEALHQRVEAPRVAVRSGLQARDSGAPARVAVTFSGHFEPEVAGFYVFAVETIGQAAIYIDGLNRLRVGEPGEAAYKGDTRVYLSGDPHELIVRYMSDQPVRALNVTIAREDGQEAPLQDGLFSRRCP